MKTVVGTEEEEEEEPEGGEPAVPNSNLAEREEVELITFLVLVTCGYFKFLYDENYFLYVLIIEFDCG